MKVVRRPFGAGGAHVPVIGLCTWMMERDEGASIEAIRRCIDEGAGHIDTAEMYGSGEVERIVGRAIKGMRENLFLVSKVLPSNATFDGTLRACEGSLRRLGVETIDCYLLHWRERDTPLAETFRAFDKLQRKGKIGAYGVSNFDVADMEEAVRIAGEGRIACNQVFYHLQERAVEHQLIAWCAARGIAVVAYSPFGQGNFPAANDILREVAAANRSTPRQAAIAFLTRHPNVLAIPKTSSVPHLLENLGAAGLTLTADDVRRLDAAFPIGPPRPLPMI